MFGKVSEGGFVGVRKGFELAFAFIIEMIGRGCLSVVGADGLADVASKGVAACVKVGWQGVVAVLDGVVGGASTGVKHRGA